MVDIKAIIEVLNGVEDNLKEQLRHQSASLYSGMPSGNEVELIQDALSDVQAAISNLIRLG